MTDQPPEPPAGDETVVFDAVVGKSRRTAKTLLKDYWHVLAFVAFVLWAGGKYVGLEVMRHVIQEEDEPIAAALIQLDSTLQSLAAEQDAKADSIFDALIDVRCSRRRRDVERGVVGETLCTSEDYRR